MSARTEAPGLGTGIYTPKQARSLVATFDRVDLAPTVVGRWMRRRRHRALLTFDDLLSLRVAAALITYGLAFREVLDAEQHLTQRFHHPTPFATAEFKVWGTDIVTEETGGDLESAVKQGQRAFLIPDAGRWLSADALRAAVGPLDVVDFRDGSPVSMRWGTYITLRPDVQFGEPCIDGTRIPTETVAALASRGLGDEEIAEEYDLGVRQVEEALLFERRNAA